MLVICQNLLSGGMKIKETIVVPDGVNAATSYDNSQVKGLSFNVVMIPFNWEGSKFSELWVDSSIQTNKLLQMSD